MTERPTASDDSSTVTTASTDGRRSLEQHDERPSAPIVETSDLTKRYGSTLALDHVSLSVEPGELVGLLGPNGAGKSTLIKILTTITAPTAGTATVAGVDVRERPTDVRNRISYIPQKTGVDDWLTGRKSLELFARFYRIPPNEVADRIAEALSLVDLADHADQKTSTYSGGMKRRLELASGLLHHPEVVILDEPTIGLDPRVRREVWDAIRTIQQHGVTIFLATHYLDEADELCDRVAIMNEGQVVTVDTPAALKQTMTGDGDHSLDDAFLHLTKPQEVVAR